MNKLANNAKQIQTTLIGLIGLLVTVGIAWGKLSAEEGAQVKDLATEVVSGLVNLSLIFVAKD